MLAQLRARHPGASIIRILYWHFMHFLCFLWVGICYRYRAWGIHNIPRQGPVLLVATHQSFMDPILVGLASHHRQFYALARANLWETRWLAPIIDSLNAIPVDQEAADLAAMRKCIEVLKQDQALLIFPEGARTEDGGVAPFAPGIMLIVKRAKPRIVPVAIEGAFDVWSRFRRLPKLCGRIGVEYGKPIDADDLLKMDKPTEFLRDHCDALRQDLAAKLNR